MKMLSKKFLADVADVEKRIQDVRAADRWIKAPYLAAIQSGMEESTAPYDLAADFQLLLGELTSTRNRLDCAMQALYATGLKQKEGAQEWNPPLGQSASPLLDTIDQLREQVASLQLLCGTKATEQGVRDLLESLKLKFSTPVDALLTNMGAAGNQRAFEVLESINHRGEQDVQALTVAYAQKAMRVKELEAELEAVGAGGVQPVNQQMLEALRMWIEIQDTPAGFVGRYGRALDAAVAAQQLKVDAVVQLSRKAITQAEAQQAQQTQFEPQADDHDRPIETSEGDAREYTKGGAA